MIGFTSARSVRHATAQVVRRSRLAWAPMASVAVEHTSHFCAPMAVVTATATPPTASFSPPLAASPTTEEATDEGLTTRPTHLQLKRLFVHAAIPMVAFGFVDNTVLIYAGDFIDNTMGVRFALPTLAAAAMGQVFSDTSGVLCGGTIESIALKMNLPLPGLSMAQQRMTITKVVSTSAGVLGVILGCCLGMCNLLFLDLGAAERAKRKEEVQKAIGFVMQDGKELLQCERTTLWMVDRTTEPHTCWTAHADGGFAMRIPADTGVVGASFATRKLINVKNTATNVFFAQGLKVMEKTDTSFVSRNMICMPVTVDGNVVALIQLINKVDDDGVFQREGFTDTDERLATMLSHHCSLLLSNAGTD